MLETIITLLLIGIIIVSMFIGFALGQICQRIEDKQCAHLPTNPHTAQDAPSAE